MTALAVSAGAHFRKGTAKGEELAAVRAMNEAEFEEFYRKTARPLWAYLYRVSGERTVAEDLLQESFLRFLRAPSAKMEEVERKAYLYRIATNLLADHWRALKRRKKTETEELSEGLADASFSPGGEEGKMLGREIARIFSGLKPRERALLWLAYVEGSQHREIAGRIGVRPASVRVLLYRARQRMASLLRERGLGPEVIR